MWVEDRTSVVAVVGLTTGTIAVLGLGSPVSHAAQLVTLGEGSIGDAIEHVVARGRGAPSVFGGEGRHEVGDGEGGHDGQMSGGT